MKCKEILRKLEQEIPPEYAESWDNSGLQVGRKDADIKKIYLALDATEEVLDHCEEWGADLLLTHHPLLMGGIKRIDGSDLHGRKILRMAENHITHYAMHTNFDVARMGILCSEYLHMSAQEPLEETVRLTVEESGTEKGAENHDPEMTGCSASHLASGMPGEENARRLGIGAVGNLPAEMTVEECCALVKDAFGLASVKVFGDLKKTVRRAALCPGSGKSLIKAALAKQAQIYITGDIGHHDGIDAVDQGLVILDAGHYGVEHVFLPWMENYIKETFPELEVRVEPIAEPFRVV